MRPANSSSSSNGRLKAADPAVRRTAVGQPGIRAKSEGEEMAEITASMVKELREKTDAPMMECKKALTEGRRRHGKAKKSCASSLATRPQGSGARHRRRRRRHVTWPATASRRDGRSQLRNRLRRQERRIHRLANGAPSWSPKRTRPTWPRCRRADGRGHGRVDPRRALVGKIGENMSIRRFCRSIAKGQAGSPTSMAAPRSACWSTWSAATSSWPRIWRCTSPPKTEGARFPGVAGRPVDAERRIAIEKAREAGKPEANDRQDRRRDRAEVPEGRDAARPGFVKAEDGKQTIEQLLKAKGASVAGFTLYVVGEGIEKKVRTDFAAEVPGCRPPLPLTRRGTPMHRPCHHRRYKRILLEAVRRSP